MNFGWLSMKQMGFRVRIRAHLMTVLHKAPLMRTIILITDKRAIRNLKYYRVGQATRNSHKVLSQIKKKVKAKQACKQMVRLQTRLTRRPASASKPWTRLRRGSAPCMYAPTHDVTRFLARAQISSCTKEDILVLAHSTALYVRCPSRNQERLRDITECATHLPNSDSAIPSLTHNKNHNRAAQRIRRFLFQIIILAIFLYKELQF